MTSINPAERVDSAAVPSGSRSLARLADSVPNQVWTAHPDGRLDYVNARILEYFGRDYDQMIGQGWQDVIHPADIAQVLEAWTRSLHTGEPYEVEFRLRRTDGAYHWHIRPRDARA